MAEFCTKCSEKLFGDEIKPDIDIKEIADSLQPGYYINTLCEGCGLVLIIKAEDGTINVGLLPIEGREELDIMTLDEFTKIDSRGEI